MCQVYIHNMLYGLHLRKMESNGGLKQESGKIRLKCYKDHTGCCVTDELEENPIKRQEHLFGSQCRTDDSGDLDQGLS